MKTIKTMHGNILNQRVNFFSIKAHRNYSMLESRKFLYGVKNIDLQTKGIVDLLFFTDDGEKKQITNLVSSFTLPPAKYKNKVYFTSNRGEWESLPVQPCFKDHPTFNTTSVRQLKNHYNNPFSEVTTTIFERNITLTETFLSVRVNRYTKFRGLNTRYFKKNQRSFGFKIDFKTGNITSYESNGNKKNKSSKIRRNSFIFLSNIFKIILDSPNAMTKQGRQEKGLQNKIDNEFDNQVFLDTLYRTLCSIMDIEDYSYKIVKNPDINLISEMVIKLFVKLKKIKVPNEYTNYLVNWYPTQKYLKKNDNKLILSILDRLNLKTKSFVKLFHDNPNINIKNLITLSMMFGYADLKKYITNLDSRYYIDNLSLSRQNLENSYPNTKENYEYNLKQREKSRLVKLLNSVFYDMGKDSLPENLVGDQMRQIVDHILMINKIREYIPTIELNCTNIKDFHHEHIEYSKIERSIQKGYSIEYTFDQRLVNRVEQEIIAPVGDDFYIPVILKTDGEYTEEGSHMHHCVASYADRELSLIISIRKNGRVGHERVTCEFNVKSKDLVQAKYFCNAIPPEEFQLAIKKLTHLIKTYRGSIQSTGKQKIPLVINGIQIPIIEKKDTLAFLLDQINQINEF